VARSARQYGVESVPIVVDLRNLDALDSFMRQLGPLESRVTVLVHNAAVMRVTRVEDVSVEEFGAMLTLNLLAPFILTQRLLPQLCASKGQIVFINSSIVNHPSEGTTEYAASKHALKGFADGLRAEVNASGVRVISVYPGRTATPLQASLSKIEGRIYLPETLLQPEDVASVVVNALLLPRTGEVTDIMIRAASKSMTQHSIIPDPNVLEAFVGKP